MRVALLTAIMRAERSPSRGIVKIAMWRADASTTSPGRTLMGGPIGGGLGFGAGVGPCGALLRGGGGRLGEQRHALEVVGECDAADPGLGAG
jgi:hypothetical protein